MMSWPCCENATEEGGAVVPQEDIAMMTDGGAAVPQGEHVATATQEYIDVVTSQEIDGAVVL